MFSRKDFSLKTGWGSWEQLKAGGQGWGPLKLKTFQYSSCILSISNSKGIWSGFRSKHVFVYLLVFFCRKCYCPGFQRNRWKVPEGSASWIHESPWYDLRGWLGVKQQLSIWIHERGFPWIHHSSDVHDTKWGDGVAQLVECRTLI